MTELPKEMWREILGFELLPRNRRISSIHNDIEQELIDEKVQKLRNTFPNAKRVQDFVYEDDSSGKYQDINNSNIKFVTKNVDRFIDMFDSDGIKYLGIHIGTIGYRSDIDRYLSMYPHNITSVAYGAFRYNRLSIIRFLHKDHNLNIKIIAEWSVLRSNVDILEWCMKHDNIDKTYLVSILFRANSRLSESSINMCGYIYNKEVNLNWLAYVLPHTIEIFRFVYYNSVAEAIESRAFMSELIDISIKSDLSNDENRLFLRSLLIRMVHHGYKDLVISSIMKLAEDLEDIDLAIVIEEYENIGINIERLLSYIEK